jgi:hypothetical protein
VRTNHAFRRFAPGFIDSAQGKALFVFGGARNSAFIGQTLKMLLLEPQPPSDSIFMRNTVDLLDTFAPGFLPKERTS